MPSRVLICRSNPIAPDPRVEKTARALTDAGYPVEIIGWDRSGNLARSETTGAGQIHRLAIKAKYGRGLGNLPNLLRWQAGLLAWLTRNRTRFDLIHACDFDTVIPALIGKRLWGKRLIYDIFDFYADHLRNTPAVLKRVIRAADLNVIAQCDAVILADDARIDQIAGARPQRRAVIYNSPQDILPDLMAHPPDDSQGELHIAYVGLLQRERGLLEMLEVLERHPSWTLDMAGFGGDEDVILPHAKRLPNVTWHGRVSYEQALQLYYCADVLVATYDPEIPNHRYSSPNKVFESMMLGKPIVVAQDTNMDRIINASQSGFVVTYGDVAELEAALSNLSQDPGLRVRLGNNGRQAYEQEYSWEIMASRLLDLYAQVASKPSPARPN